ncbi:MAG: dihydroneopterin triphosphate diphosphatase [Gammaproteobacteria bacterium]|nr:dihydroneopterin triphosphate diphosphatase [Gammaproteobacteria bacterium]
MKPYKRPESVLIVIYARTGKVLLMKRADHPDFWQSVTGAMDWHETDPRVTAARELGEETGFVAMLPTLRDLELTQTYTILPHWRHRYAPGVAENVERAFAFELAAEVPPMLAPKEHTEYVWVDFAEGIARVTSWTNRVAIERIYKEWPAA